MNLLWIMSLSLSFLIIYSNLKKLNEIVLWFLPLGGTLIIINGIYWLKYTIKLLKKIQYWFRGERYLVKYLIMLLLLFMLWQGYQQRETVFDPVMGIYNKTNFSEVLPLNLTIPWSDFNSSVAKDLDESEASTIQKILFKPPKRKEESKKALDYVNQIRHENNRQFLEWDDNLYELAVFRSEDMEKRGYFDHVTPEGKCVKDFKAHYNLSQYNIAENVGGMTHYEDGNPIPETSVNEAVDSWLTSRGHRYNLLYPSHVKGAIGCYKSICVFLGANTEYYGLGYGPCHTGDEGLSFWRSVEKQPGEL